MVDQMDAAAAQALRETGKVPVDAIPMQGGNLAAAPIVDTTPVELVAAPANAAHAHFVSYMVIHQPTAAETPIIDIQDGNASPTVLYSRQMAASETSEILEFKPPLQFPVGEAIDGKATTANGDTVVRLGGWTGTPVT